MYLTLCTPETWSLLGFHLLYLQVPGVSENRPSVLRGDSLLVYPEGESEVKYRGYVYSVQLDSVRLGFASE